MIAVEWLENEYNTKGKLTPVDFFQAKEMKRKNKISDEEIENAAKEYDFQSTRYGAKTIFLDAIKWYKEQLK